MSNSNTNLAEAIQLNKWENNITTTKKGNTKQWSQMIKTQLNTNSFFRIEHEKNTNNKIIHQKKINWIKRKKEGTLITRVESIASRARSSEPRKIKEKQNPSLM